MSESLFGKLVYVGFSVEMPGTSEASNEEITQVS
jgi:hypothetical protein